MAIRFRGRCDFLRAKISERLVSSPDESPKQRSREDDFSGLIDLWRMTDIEEPSRGAG